MSRETVGKLSSDLLQKEPDTRDPIALEREAHKDYEKHIVETIESSKKKYLGDFYIVVLTRGDRLMLNVIRNQFLGRQSCPTPEYDQTVYKYLRTSDTLEFLWVIPSKDACQYLVNNALEVVPEERWLLDYVLKFTDGTLFSLCKRLNGERIDSPFLTT